MLSDIEIAQNAKLKPISEIAGQLGIDMQELENYGRYKAKINMQGYKRITSSGKKGRLILVTAMSPTPAGEGKTTTTIGLGQAFSKLGKRAVIALREPSLGPVFGMKGGAAGGGYSQVVPMEDINLHFTGDLHAITAANNLLCAVIDNHIFTNNTLDIDPERITFKRCMDMNDRSLRVVRIGLAGKTGGVPRDDGFVITAASEIMALFCLSSDINDLKRRIGNIIVGYTYAGKPVKCSQLGVAGALTALLRDALCPNIVQTLENTPCIIHGGPFANIAHGCNSIMATRLALGLGDYAVTEAGFGADLGAEKFFDIKCRTAGFDPAAVVLVVTVRSLKYSGGVSKDELKTENIQALGSGFVNLLGHYKNLQKFGYNAVVSINRFPSDTDAELKELMNMCAAEGIACAVCEGYARGGDGATELAKLVVDACEKAGSKKLMYQDGDSLAEKINSVAVNIYGAGSVSFSDAAREKLAAYENLGYGGLPVCIAKTQFSFSDDMTKLGRPIGFELTVRDVVLYAGAGFVTALTGSIVTMPKLPDVPSAEAIDVDENGVISGLF